jgi:7-carboxy-7-deazaguanine synthase
MLRLLEHYTSIQGECDRTGTPTQFVRFAGCNLKCPGWPCDTPFAIFPKQFMKEQELVPVRDFPMDRSDLHQGSHNGLIGRIVLVASETGAHNICLTGGEPMLQPSEEIEDLIRSLVDNWAYTLEMFSNGTLKYPKEVMKYCAIRMDWKLPGSGEHNEGDRVTNYYAMGEWQHHTIKFTVKDHVDFEEAMAIYEKFDMEDWPGSIYVGPVWDSEYTAKDVADGILAYQLPWKLNIQTHNYVYGAQTRRT